MSDYDRTCTSVADCAPVYIGPVGCCGGGCPNAAVRATLATKVMADVEAARRCDAKIPPPCAPPGVCPDGRVECVAGTCALEMPDAGPAD